MYASHCAAHSLRAAVANLAPFILRVGGSLADQVVYEATCDGLGFVANASDYRGFGFSGGCVEYARVHELLDWCSELGCEVGPPEGCGPFAAEGEASRSKPTALRPTRASRHVRPLALTVCSPSTAS